MKRQERIEMAIDFILAQRTLEECFRHEQIRHQLRAVGITMKKAGDLYFVREKGDEVPIRNLMALIEFLR